MEGRIARCLLPLLLVALAGCVAGGTRDAARGRRLSTWQQAAVADAVARAGASVVLVRLKGLKDQGPSFVFEDGVIRETGSQGGKDIPGLVLTTNGHVLVVEKIDLKELARVEAWIGDVEFRAKVLKTDDQLGMTILKLDAAEPLCPIDLDGAADLRVGDWCLGLQPTDETQEFERLANLLFCRGQVAGRYREFLLDEAQSLKPGMAVLDLSGRIAGLVVGRGRALAANDLREDLAAFLDDARGVSAPDEEAKKKAWFGAIMVPVNREYARKHGITKSALWVGYLMADGPAAKAGVREGDLVVAVNGRPMCLTGARAGDFFLKALRPRVDRPFAVTVLRGGREVACTGVFTKRPEEQTVKADDIGVTVKRIEDSDVGTQGLFTRAGVLVTEVRKGSPAMISGNMRHSLIQKGDVLTAVGGEPTPDMETFSAVLEKVRRERPAVLLLAYLRGRTTGLAALNLRIGENGDREEGNP